MLRDLSKYYGKDKSFNDAELFDKITEITKFPEIRQFFAKYIEGKEPLPVAETLKSVGIDYIKERKKREKTLGFSVYNLGINPETKGIFIIDEDGIDEFGRKLAFKTGDELVSLNGKALDLANFRNVRTEFMANAKEGDEMNYIVLRKEGEKKVETKLSGKVFIPEVVEKNLLTPMENLTEAQTNLQRAWLVPSN
jgi:predicted metalloprotease with PDZ domain